MWAPSREEYTKDTKGAKNRTRGRGTVTSPRFDLADLAGKGEGGLRYF